jgi:DNA-binding MltR family transcriptional regulator
MAKGLNRFLKSQVPIEESNLVAREIKTDAPRGASMVAASFLDAFLLKLIQRHLVKLSDSEANALFEPDRPLGTFSSRIKLARALSIFGKKTAHDLNTLREIRNAFAHGLRKMDFETPEVKQLMFSFHCLKDIEDYKTLKPGELFFEITAMLSTHLDTKMKSSPTERAVPKLAVFCNHLD